MMYLDALTTFEIPWFFSRFDGQQCDFTNYRNLSTTAVLMDGILYCHHVIPTYIKFF